MTPSFEQTPAEQKHRKHATRILGVLQKRELEGGLSPLEEQNGKLPMLLSGDIVLIRHKKGSLAHKILRIITDSYWDHTAMIMYRENHSRGYSSNVILESLRGGWTKPYYFGAELHRLNKYLDDPEKFDIGIKRFTWLDKSLRQRVRAYALAYVDTPYYPYWTWKFLLGLIIPSVRKRILATQRYTCSALIQKAYYEAVDLADRQKIMFRKLDYMPIQLLDITSPADIANSDVTTWIYNQH
ncbi:MAG: hypothetical protein KC662_01440 [Candidatus Magasanikbacteria bacterium]|nr:hypothetical protein [Candidatus Magasanikbacteria bacterium]